jgi:hypothetical protein
MAATVFTIINTGAPQRIGGRVLRWKRPTMRQRKDSPPPTPLRPRRDSTGKFIIWGMVQPKRDECCRWEAVDGRWVSLALGKGDEIGSVVVSSSSGVRELVDSYEGALELAKKWRE